MNIYTLRNVNDENSFLDIFNEGEYILSYKGYYLVGGFRSRFITPPMFPTEHLRITFPDDANKVNFIVRVWLVEEAMWKDFATVTRRLPRGYCFRCYGTETNPLIQAITCPTNFR